jgi:hypothetical protein
MTDPPRSRFRLPHWGWFLLATVVLVIAGIGLSIWLPWHREQQVIQRIESWGGYATAGTVGPKWLRKLVGEIHMKEFKVFERTAEVQLQRRAINDTQIAHLGGLKNLEVLDLERTAVTDAGLNHLSKLTKLQSLGLNGTAVTDSGLAHLNTFTNLRILILSNTAVTDAGLIHLSGLTNLHTLQLFGTAVTATGIEKLQKTLPDCKIDR